MLRFVIISDDLTGANDTGVQFAKQGFNTISLLDMAYTEKLKDADVLVVNAETRSLDSQRAFERIKAVSQQLHLTSVPFVYKKIDSTMRGNIGAEMDALMDLYAFDVAIVAPAYPKNGRLTIGGYHFVGQVLLEDSEIASDPKSPIKESHLPTLIAQQSKRSVGHIELKEIRKPGIDLVDQIRQLVSRGNQIIVFDSGSLADMQSITAAVSESGLRTLWVGSAGLAQTLSEILSDQKSDKIKNTPKVVGKNFPALVVAGSVSTVTRQQIEALSEQAAFGVISAKPLAFLDEQEQSLEFARVIGLILKTIDDGKNPVVTSDASQSARLAVEQWMMKNGKDGLYAGNLIADGLGKLAAAVMSERQLGGLVVTGGDIAYRTCDYLQAVALQIFNEVEEGLPMACIMGGPAEGLPIVTKAGAFGSRTSLVRAVEKIKTYQQG